MASYHRLSLATTTLCHGDRKVKLRAGQLTSTTIGKVFSLFPDTIILISSDGALETADYSGFFFPDDLLSEQSINQANSWGM